MNNFRATFLSIKPDFIITPGNVNDRKPLNDMDLHKRIFGKLYGDKGYISKDLFEKLFVDGVHLITKIKKYIKNSLEKKQKQALKVNIKLK